MSRKKSKKTKQSRTTKKTLRTRSIKGRVLSFLIGVVTVLAIAFLIFQYAKDNNYKEVLGKKTIEYESVR